MMRYLALLRDSYREALDSKVIYFTFGLSLLMVLLLASMSFRPVSVKDDVEFMCGISDWSSNVNASSKGKSAGQSTVTEYEEIGDDLPPWEKDYRLTVTVNFPKDFAGTPEAQTQRLQTTEIVRASLTQVGLRDLKIEQEQTADGEAAIIRVRSHGTRITDRQHWRHEPSLFFGLVPMPLFRGSLTGSVYWIENILVNNIGAWVIILIGVVVTAFFIPNMLQKGSLDLLLVKPVTRVGLLGFKYLGGLLFVFLNSLIAIGGVWLVLGVRTGIWTPGFPLTILVITFFFAILYSVSALFGVLTRSAVLAIFMTCIAWVLLFVLAQAHYYLNRPAPTPGGEVAAEHNESVTDIDPTLRRIRVGVNVLYTILPRTSDLGSLTADLVSWDLLSEDERRAYGLRSDETVKWGESVGVSLAFIAVMLGLASLRFATKDY